MDTTYFDTFGVMVFRCWNRRQNLFWKFVEEETNEMYLSGLTHLQETGFTVVGVVCDGKRWLAQQIQALGFPVQLCQFHFTKTMTRYLTKKPKTSAGRSLRSLALNAKRMNEKSFTEELDLWHEKYNTFLAEKTVSIQTGRWQYTHRNVRSAYRTAIHWLPYLFTYKKYPELNIPNTTNTLDGTFSHVKNKVNLHRGLNDETKRKMIAMILNQPSLPKRIKTNWKMSCKPVFSLPEVESLPGRHIKGLERHKSRFSPLNGCEERFQWVIGVSVLDQIDLRFYHIKPLLSKVLLGF